MSLFKCKMCGGSLEITGNETVAECEYCGTKQTLPGTRDDAMTNLFNRANNLRMKCEFDKALQLYEKIIEQNDSEAEAHWGAVLCKYGIEYVEDPKTLTRIPTCHRTSYDAVTTDADYLAAIDYSDTLQQAIYEQEARAIDRIQRDILAVVEQEKPFDVFICYKETDENGKRTVDSTISNDIYYQLTQEGFKVFYAAITLEDKLGQEYEPYIFAALNSAKVMLVLGTKPEYFNAVWVKNEWSRYLKLMKSDRQKLLIPCYRDMDAYDLPEEFAHLQSQDMSKIGFINDVVRGIKKVVQKDEPVQAAVVKETVVTGGNANTEPLLKRAFMFLADEEWDNADEYCEKVLDIDPECAEAYLGKLMAEYKIGKREDLYLADGHINNDKNYQKAYQFGDAKLRSLLESAEMLIESEEKYLQAEKLSKREESEKRLKASELYKKLGEYKDSITRATDCIESIYRSGVALMEKNTEISYENAIDDFSLIKDYKDSTELIEKCKIGIKECIYQGALKKMSKDTESLYYEAIEDCKRIPDYKDSVELIEKCKIGIIEPKYQLAKAKMDSDTEGEYIAAINILNTIKDYKDSEQLIEECNVGRKECIYKKAVGLMEENTTFGYESAKKQLIRISDWRNSKELIEYCDTRIEEIHDEAEKQKEIQRVAREKAKKKAKRTALIICSVVVAVIIGIILFLFLGVPAIKRHIAEKLLSEGKYDEGYAIIIELDGQESVNSHKYERAKAYLSNKEFDKAMEIFAELGDYSDSEELLKECKYQKAIELYENNNSIESKNIIETYELFISIKEYKDSETRAKSIYNEYKKIILENIEIKSSIFFGSYEQDDNTSNGKEDIEWIVLDLNSDKALIISKYALDSLCYKNNSWESSYLRRWLNSDFINSAFNDEEKSAIHTSFVHADKLSESNTDQGKSTNDDIFLLSYTEVEKYFGSSNPGCNATPYAKSRGIYTSAGSDRCYWWLRTMFTHRFNEPAAVAIDPSGDRSFIYVSLNGAVRPAMWIDLSKIN